jgi:ribosomal protein L34E
MTVSDKTVHTRTTSQGSRCRDADCQRPLPRRRSVAIDPRAWEGSRAGVRATGRSPDSQAGIEMPRHAAFPNHRHGAETPYRDDPVTGRPEGTALARLRLLTVAGAVRALRRRSSKHAPCSRLTRPLENIPGGRAPVAYGLAATARTPRRPRGIVASPGRGRKAKESGLRETVAAMSTVCNNRQRAVRRLDKRSAVQRSKLPARSAVFCGERTERRTKLNRGSRPYPGYETNCAAGLSRSLELPGVQ